MSSSPSEISVPTVAAKPAGGKKRRPTFRPASQRKTSKKTAGRKESPSEAKSSKQTDGEPPGAPTGDAALTSTDAMPRVKHIKKRSKGPAGVSIGLKRVGEESSVGEPLPLEASVTATEVRSPTAPALILAATAAPATSLAAVATGQRALSSFCSTYRTKTPMEKGVKPKTGASSAATAVSTPTSREAPSKSDAIAASTAGPVVQVVNGEIVLQESSMVVSGARRSVEQVEEEFEQVVEEEGHSAVVGASYNSFVSRRAPQHWSVTETKKFYHALRQMGPDFGTMEAIFENRTRKQLKRKYQIENSKNPHLIELALNPKAQVPLDMSAFKVDTVAAKKGGNSNKIKTATSSVTADPAASLLTGGDTSTQISSGGEIDEEQDVPGASTNQDDVPTDAENNTRFDMATAANAEEEFVDPPPEPFFEDNEPVNSTVGTAGAIPLAPEPSTKPRPAPKRPKFKATRSSKRGK